MICAFVNSELKRGFFTLFFYESSHNVTFTPRDFRIFAVDLKVHTCMLDFVITVLAGNKNSFIAKYCFKHMYSYFTISFFNIFSTEVQTIYI